MAKTCRVTKLLFFYGIFEKNGERGNGRNLAVRRAFAQQDLITLDYVKLIGHKKSAQKGGNARI